MAALVRALTPIRTQRGFVIGWAAQDRVILNAVDPITRTYAYIQGNQGCPQSPVWRPAPCS